MNQYFYLLSLRFFSRLGVVGIICCFLVSCGSSLEEKTSEFEKPFFDFPAYFQSEIERLNDSSPKFKKEVTFNDVMEPQDFKQVDFSEELKLFAAIDINRRALMDKYHSDSILVNDQMNRLTYTALDSSLNIRSIIIDYEEGEIAQVDIYKKQKNFVGFSRQHLRYKPHEGYTINSAQKIILSDLKTLKIETSFR